MSLLAHLARATLAPEAAVQPALPQTWANWQAGVADDEAWGEEVTATEASPPPRAAPKRDDPFASRERVAAPPRSGFAEFPDNEPVPPPGPARSGRGAEPAAEATRLTPAPPPRAADPRPELLAEEAPPPRRRARASALVELPEPPVVSVEPTPAAPHRSPPVGPQPVETTTPRVVTPEVTRAAVEIPERPARHDPPIAARAEPAEPTSRRRDPPRLEEPRVVREVIRERVSAPEAPEAAQLAAPLIVPQPVAAPVLAAPQVIAPDAPEPAAPRMPDVHISIGRVEVRAATAPPRPAQREGAAKAEPLSLDAYLNRRSGGAGR